MKNWPYNYYLINHKYKIIYCAIPKNASGFLRRWFLILSGHNPKKLPSKNISKLLHPYILKNKKFIQKYNNFVFVRNPYHRLVSGFLNKFSVQNPSVRKITHPIIKYAKKIDNNINEYNITFTHFINYLYDKKNLNKEDDHWKPQYLFLDNNKFDYIGKIENFTEDFNNIRNIYNIPDTELTEITNKHLYDKNRDKYEAQFMGIKELTQLDICPHYKDFFDANLTEKTQHLYKTDINIFGYKL